MVSMKKTIYTVASLIILVVGTGIFLAANADHVLSLSAQEPGKADTIVEINKQQFIVELATTVEQHSQGLSERPSLPTGQGMLFVFQPAQTVSFWMNKMRFNLDMLFIANGRVINIEWDVPVPSKADPSKLPTYSASQAVDYVLEVNAGEAKNIKVGDIVNIRKYNQT